MTEQLLAWKDGNREAFEKVVSLLYEDLRRVARSQLYRGRPGSTLNTTALVHETYLKLVGQAEVECESRGHFFALVARAMRQIIVDHARRRQAEKRGGAQACLPLDEADAAVWEEAEGLIALDQALTRLATTDERLSRLVECRFFAGLTEEETATALGISRRTVQRDWIRARALLRNEVGASLKGGGS
jgi:RNA polymerase sigma factor (TIGR02999 family)